jgi:hypothetical protein
MEKVRENARRAAVLLASRSSGLVEVPFPELVDLGVPRLVAGLRAKHMPTG